MYIITIITTLNSEGQSPASEIHFTFLSLGVVFLFTSVLLYGRELTFNTNFQLTLPCICNLRLMVLRTKSHFVTEYNTSGCEPEGRLGTEGICGPAQSLQRAIYCHWNIMYYEISLMLLTP